MIESTHSKNPFRETEEEFAKLRKEAAQQIHAAQERTKEGIRKATHKTAIA